ncbi:hypothetical protein BDN72DRAFT_466095 [Pluteus cervinus]|uniref:Uncharacterized protein n=1 Tax=Pluteus cervinus TaxID=181527 RepID=A0ACD3A6P9_9AGAR|nr:hypothetical protein BDN72DRAFT_466095 [Pluteus cervinus]
MLGILDLQVERQKASRRGSPAALDPEATLISLPTELLLWIFEDLDSQTLYHLGVLSRRLNLVALPILVQRYCPSIQQRKLNLSEYNPTVYAAICASITITYLDRLYVTLQPAPFAQLKMLSGIVESIESLHALSIRLTNLGFSPGQSKKEQEKSEELTVALKRFMNACAAKGCAHIYVHGTWGPDYLAGTALVLATSSTSPLQGKRIPSATLSPSEDLRGLPSPTVPGMADYPIARHLASIDFDSPLFFQESWQDWTVHLCNTAPLTSLNVDSLAIGLPFNEPNEWAGLLPKLYLTCLTTFKITGSASISQNLAIFLQRHSDTLEHLLVRLHGPEVPQPSSVRSLDGVGGCFEVHHLERFNFPRLSLLTLQDINVY